MESSKFEPIVFKQNFDKRHNPPLWVHWIVWTSIVVILLYTVGPSTELLFEITLLCYMLTSAVLFVAVGESDDGIALFSSIAASKVVPIMPSNAAFELLSKGVFSEGEKEQISSDSTVESRSYSWAPPIKAPSMYEQDESKYYGKTENVPQQCHRENTTHHNGPLFSEDSVEDKQQIKRRRMSDEGEVVCSDTCGAEGNIQSSIPPIEQLKEELVRWLLFLERQGQEHIDFAVYGLHMVKELTLEWIASKNNNNELSRCDNDLSFEKDQLLLDGQIESNLHVVRIVVDVLQTWYDEFEDHTSRKDDNGSNMAKNDAEIKGRVTVERLVSNGCAVLANLASFDTFKEALLTFSPFLKTLVKSSLNEFGKSNCELVKNACSLIWWIGMMNSPPSSTLNMNEQLDEVIAFDDSVLSSLEAWVGDNINAKSKEDDNDSVACIPSGMGCIILRTQLILAKHHLEISKDNKADKSFVQRGWRLVLLSLKRFGEGDEYVAELGLSALAALARLMYEDDELLWSDEDVRTSLLLWTESVTSSSGGDDEQDRIRTSSTSANTVHDLRVPNVWAVVETIFQAYVVTGSPPPQHADDDSSTSSSTAAFAKDFAGKISIAGVGCEVVFRLIRLMTKHPNNKNNVLSQSTSSSSCKSSGMAKCGGGDIQRKLLRPYVLESMYYYSDIPNNSSSHHADQLLNMMPYNSTQRRRLLLIRMNAMLAIHALASADEEGLLRIVDWTEECEACVYVMQQQILYQLEAARHKARIKQEQQPPNTLGDDGRQQENSNEEEADDLSASSSLHFNFTSIWLMTVQKLATISAANQAMLGAEGPIELAQYIVRVLLQSDSKPQQLQCCKTIYSLCSKGNFANCERFGQVGALRAIFHALSQDEDDDGDGEMSTSTPLELIQMGCKCLYVLAQVQENKQRLRYMWS